ncbi:M14 metallopeptidase family protein [Pseudozobellia sp. WGM2]|uniref:M14 family metallopeptidase n=1 Tax=Pseudozobellia sp. WGM2 TaxID=2787625 RepID=UPI001AE0B306|nr:M14 metallopeptidase family protein [Pseudozobellia sp. WGM2]
MNLSFKEYSSIKNTDLHGRYITHDKIVRSIKKLNDDFKVDKIGKSVQNRSIEMITFGSGPIKVLMWSQMHGNESTTTKAVFDLINLVVERPEISRKFLENCTISIIPMLNPDGAEVYTRVNANEIDLNRDAQKKTQPESLVLRNAFKRVKPDFCFNLHDQRTIFNVGQTSEPATVSFLAPAHDEERSISNSRATSMKLIVAMNEVLQRVIPNRVGRYDDSFNANCVGDTFQMLDVPTILFESGHSPNDYQREETRQYIFYALLTALSVISDNKVVQYEVNDYFEIPENQKSFVDILVKNPQVNWPKLETYSGIGFLFKEVLQDETVHFKPILFEFEFGQKYYAHQVFDCAIESDLQKLKEQFYYSELNPIFDSLS